MKRLFLDCQMGIAGDMLTATLLGLVDNPEIWIERLNQIGIPNVTYVCDIKLDTNEAGKPITVVTREHDLGYEVVQATLPVLVTATLALNEPRVPTLWQSIYAKRYAIEHITVNDMEVDKERLGLGGSPTRVRKVYQPPLRAKVVMMDGSVADMATQVVNMARTVKGGATHE